MASFAEHFDADYVRALADRARVHAPGFEASPLLAGVVPRLDGLALKERVAAIADALLQGLAVDLPEALPVLQDLAGPEGDPSDPGQSDLDAWPLLTVVERHGLACPEASLAALAHLTRRFSAEFAIRPFLQHHPDRTWHRLQRWAEDPSSHVRRLVSEGTRPRLPWGQRVPALIRDPAPGLALLDRLVDDPVDNVRRSVANHLNDVSKDHPEAVVALAGRWLDTDGLDRARTVRHGLRTLVKRGHGPALRLLGAPPDLPVHVEVAAPERVAWAATLEVPIRVTSLADHAADAIVDVRITVPTPSGGHRTRVFKGRTRTLAPGASMTLTQRLAMVPRSTRPLHPGDVDVVVQVNGRDRARARVHLDGPAASGT